MTVAGDTTVIDVGELTTTEVPLSVPNLTVAPVTKPVPVIVTLVPPTVLPDVVPRLLTVGTVAVYAKSSAVPTVELEPPVVVTWMFAVPTVTVAGVVMVIDVAELTVTLAPGTELAPTVTVAVDRKPVPVMVTLVPPVVAPVLGLSSDTVGAGAAYVTEPFVVDPVPVELVTTTAAAPAPWSPTSAPGPRCASCTPCAQWPRWCG